MADFELVQGAVNGTSNPINTDQIRKLNLLVDVARDLTSGRSMAEVIARALAIDATTPTMCLWLALDSCGDGLGCEDSHIKQRLYQTLNAIVRLQSSNSFVGLTGVREDAFIVFLRVEAGDKAAGRAKAQAVAEAFQSAISKNPIGWTVSVGIGPLVRGLEALIASLHDVQRMVEMHQRNRQFGRIFFTEELGVDRLLLQFPDAQELTRFAEGVLGAVMQTDKTNGNGDLLNTLAAYFGNNRNIAETAKATHLHQNTVRYRLERIKELIGGSGPVDWFSVEFAVRVCRWSGALRQG